MTARALRPEETGGWMTVCGIRVAPTAGTILVAFGHPPRPQVLDALETLAQQYLRWVDLTNGFTSRVAAGRALQFRWGIFYGTDPVTWSLDYTRTGPTQRSHPVTVLDCTPAAAQASGGPR